MIKILQRENKILRQVAHPVPKSKIESPEIKKIIEKMKEAIHQEKDAVAIAAPQIGVLWQIFVVSGQVLKHKRRIAQTKRGQTQTDDKLNTGIEILHNSASSQSESADQLADQVFINPEIINKSKKAEGTEEGCLSIRWWYGKVKRYQKVTVSAFNENGKKFTRGASGLLAQIFQHEIDHLEGVLFTDKATDIRELPPEEIEEIKK